MLVFIFRISYDVPLTSDLRLFSGWLYSFSSGVSMLATTVGLYLIPMCKKAFLLIIMMAVFGASVGVVDTG